MDENIYQSANVSTALSCTIFNIFDIEEGCDLKITVGVSVTHPAYFYA